MGKLINEEPWSRIDRALSYLHEEGLSEFLRIKAAKEVLQYGDTNVQPCQQCEGTGFEEDTLGDFPCRQCCELGYQLKSATSR